MVNDKLTYISLFSGAGVGCYGLKKEGYECIATCELLPARLNIQKANNKCKYETGYISGDLTDFAVKELLFNEVKMWQEQEEITSVDVVMATPPCQGMSTVNYKKGDESKRNSLVVEAISIIQRIKPKIFVFENVKAFLKTACTDISGDIMPIKESIYRNLGDNYHIYSRVINFKDYGVPSSRPRTIVVGTRKDFIHFSPLNIFPLRKDQITVREAIGDLPSLGFGEISDDTYHFFREYPRYMEEWISHIAEGESAFNSDEQYKPYKIKGGEKVILKGAHLGNKFRRLFWDRPGACIATRNDQLASQDTIHPQDNRVLSIRELMRLMTIPDDFKWSSDDITKLNTPSEKREFLKENELNIRRCIGEAVPTQIIQTIAKNAKEMLDFQRYVEAYYASSENYGADIADSFYKKAFDYEMHLTKTKESGAYYTPQTVVFEALSTVELTEKSVVRILEPSVGMGAFLPQLFRLCDVCDSVYLDLCDSDRDAMEGLKSAAELLDYNKKSISIRYICEDFLTTERLKDHYDLIVSNPPFGRASSNVLCEYRKMYDVGKANNIFTFFLDRYLTLSEEIAVILPKSFVMASEYNQIREKYESFGITHIVDFGVKYFKEVFVEILSFHFKKGYSGKIVIENKLSNEEYIQEQGYIFHDRCWLLYRDKWFDEYIKTLQLDVFDVFRDRQITNKKVSLSGDIWVLRSKNILDNGDVVSKEGYDRFISNEDLPNYTVCKYLNSNAIIMPSFTYLTRATRLPNNCVPNGSVAVLTPKSPMGDVDLTLYAGDDFRRYYEIVKNKAKFTLNMDGNAVYYIGVKK